MRWLGAWLPLRRAGSTEKGLPGHRLLLAAVVVTSLPWLGALLAYAVQEGWPVSAAQADWLRMVRYGCATVLLAEWTLALVAGIVWAVVMVMLLVRRCGPGKAPDERKS